MNVVIRRTAAAVRRHWLITNVLVIGVMLRVAVQIAYWPALLYIDSIRYLYAEPGWAMSGAGGQPAGIRATCFLVTSTALPLLFGADIVEFSRRYQLPGLVTLPLAGALGISALTSRPRGRSRG